MTKKEYMKKLAYQLRRLPKEDFDKAMDYFEKKEWKEYITIIDDIVNGGMGND